MRTHGTVAASTSDEAATTILPVVASGASTHCCSRPVARPSWSELYAPQPKAFRLEEIDRMAQRGEIDDMKTIAGLALLQKNYGMVGVKAEGGTVTVATDGHCTSLKRTKPRDGRDSRGGASQFAATRLTRRCRARSDRRFWIGWTRPWGGCRRS